nr:serine hydrolase domain-containing protein [Georgenia thermotolerans]
MRVAVEPGTRFGYSNHGFTALGQVVEDVTGVPLATYLRAHVFAPLGMDATGLARPASGRATGYRLRAHGPAAVRDLEVVTAAGGGAWSTARDLARFAEALLGGGTNEHGSVLRPATLATMFAPQYQPDPRVPGIGLAFLRGEVGGHRTVGHDGIWLGFLADLRIAPDDGVGVLALASTGNFEPRGAPASAVEALLRLLLDAPEQDDDAVPERPWTWPELCGRYGFGPGVLVDPQPRLLLGAGLEVAVRHGHLVLRGQMPVPAVRRGLRLHPDREDPDVFRVDLSSLGLGPTRVVFGRDPGGAVAALHLTPLPMSFVRRPDRHQRARAAGQPPAAARPAPVASLPWPTQSGT